ncbi:MAG: YihY/virulence factor BrkB family protein [Myxococcaceae bacterium]|nr:YihY/virulence factor BrkB family protein [Myxococcaceae bacterium]
MNKPMPTGPTRFDRWAQSLRQRKTGRFTLDTLQGLRGLVLGFRGDSIAVRAGNLTFITLTSLVPLVAVGVALLQSFHQKRLQELLAGFIRDVLAPGIALRTDQALQHLVSAASSRTAGSVSFFVLLFSAGLLLRHLDASLNEIWAVQRKRALGVSILLYAGLVLLGPLVVGITLLGTDNLRRLVLWLQLPFSSVVLELVTLSTAMGAFTLLYKLAPHAPVRWRSALSGGLIAGGAWEIARNSYSSIAGAVFSANPVYGALGIAPLFLMWIYVSWCLVIFGARLAYAVEHAGYRSELLHLHSHPRARELIGAGLAKAVAAAVLNSSKGPTVKSAAKSLDIPAQLVAEVADALIRQGLLSMAEDGELKPTRSPETLTLADISMAVGGTLAPMTQDAPMKKDNGFQELTSIFATADQASYAALHDTHWVALVNKR